MTKRIVVSVLLALMVYPAFAFVIADLNPFNWAMEIRFLLLAAMAYVMCVAYFFPGWKYEI